MRAQLCYDGITMPERRAQFYGKHHGDNFDDIQIISGATLSSSQMAAGVKRIMSIYALVLDQPSGRRTFSSSSAESPLY